MKNNENLRSILAVVFKYKLTIFSVLGAALATVIVGTLLLPPTYEASSSLMVNFGREYVYMPEVGEHTPYNYYNFSAVINTEIEILGSRDLIEGTIDKVGVKNLYPYLQEKKLEEVPLLTAAVDEFSKNLSIIGSKESSIIRVQFQHPNPDLAANTVNTLVDLFQEKHLKIFRDPKTFSFLEGMETQYKNLLTSSEDKIEAYKEGHAAFARVGQEDILLQQRGTFDRTLKEVESDVMALKERLRVLEEHIKTMSESGPLFSETTDQDRSIDSAKAELLSLKLTEEKLLGTLYENSSKVENVRKQIQVAETFLKKQEAKKQGTVRTGKSLAFQEMETEIAKTRANLFAQEAKSLSLKEKLQDVDNDLREFALGEKQLLTLKRELTINEQNYKTYQSKLEDARTSNEMDRRMMTNIRVVHEAIAPHEPVKPRKALNLIIGFVLGAVAGVGLAFFKEYISQGFNSPESIEKRLGLPVLATISLKNRFTKK